MIQSGLDDLLPLGPIHSGRLKNLKDLINGHPILGRGMSVTESWTVLVQLDGSNSSLIDLFGVLRRFQHYTGHITTGSWKGRGNQYIQFIRVLYCKLPTNDKQLPAFPLEALPGTEPRPQRWEVRMLPLCHCGPK